MKNLHQPSNVSSRFVVGNQEEVQQLLNVLHLAGLLNIRTLFLFQLVTQSNHRDISFKGWALVSGTLNDDLDDCDHGQDINIIIATIREASVYQFF